MRFFVFGALCTLLGLAGVAMAAPTGYADDFTGGDAAKWPSNPGYKVAQADGIATIAVNKAIPWAGQQMLLGDTSDVSAHPFLTVKIKTSVPMILDVYFMEGKNAVNVARRIRAVNDFQTYGFDFSAEKNIDLHALTSLIFCANGAANSWVGTIQLQALRIGDQAVLLPTIEAVEDQEWYHDTGAHSALLTGMAHVQHLALTGADTLIRNVSFSPITNGRSTMRYELIPGASGKAQATLTAQGDEGYAPVTRTISIMVEANLPPTIDAHPPVTAQIGKPLTVRFTGVSGGNFTVYKPLTISIHSSNPAVMTENDLRADNPNGGGYLYLHGTPKKAGDTRITLTLDDKFGGVVTSTLQVHAVKEWNNPPTFDHVGVQQAFVDSGVQQIPLTGISDGDHGTQRLTLTAVSSDPKILPDPSVDYAGGKTATLHITPTATPGTANITVTVTDNGGTPDNNGDQSISRTFAITTRVRPISGYTMNLTDFPALAPSLRAEDGITVSATQDGDTPVMKIACKDKSTFSGLWLTLPAMDLSKVPYLTVDVKCAQKISFNMYFWDNAELRNDGGTQTTSIGGPANTWQTVTFDFSGKGQMATGKSDSINSTWITKALFNFHPSFGWPFSNWSGDLYMRNLRIGTAGDKPWHMPLVTIDPIPAQVYARDSGMQHLTVSGLTVENGQPITLSVDEAGAVPVHARVDAVNQGEAELTLTAAQSGRATITVTANAPNAELAKATFTVDVVDPTTPRAVTIDPDKTFQTIRGLGTFMGADVDLYAKELGASAMRIGDECDFNPCKDTSDLNVINRARLNYKAFDFDYFRQLHEAGVETFFFTAWTPPAWQKANFSANYQRPDAFTHSDACLNRLDYDCYADYAKTLVALVRMFQEEAGITFDAISLQNEPCFCEPYGSAILDPQHLVQLIDVVGPRFAKEGIPTRLLMPEQVFTQSNMIEYIQVLNADAEAQKYCNIIGTHGYDDKGVTAASPDYAGWQHMFNTAQKGTGPKELWMTETGFGCAGWSTGMYYSMILYGALEYGNISLWTQFTMEGLLLNHNKPNDSYWAVRQYYKFIRPGAKRVASNTAGDNLFVTSYLNDAKHGGKLVSILTNRTTMPTVVQLSVPARHVTGWQVITSDAVRRGAVIGNLKAGASLLLPPNSITTVVEN